MPVASVGPISLPGVQFESWLIKFNKAGECTSPQTRQALIERLAHAGDTPVILFSHGWNNDFDDATDLYRRFLAQLQLHVATHNPALMKALFVGVLWPSIWLSFDSGLKIAAGDGGGVQPDAPLGIGEQALSTELAEALPSSSDRARFDALMAASALDDDGMKELAGLVQRALARSTSDGAASEEGTQPSAADIEAAFNDMPQTYIFEDGGDDDELRPGGTIGSKKSSQVRPAGLLDFFDPRNALRVASVYQMKDRAGKVGARGVSLLLSDMLDTATGGVHLVGHSYGSKVILSALAASGSARNVSSVLLLQPAISHLAFAAKVPGTDPPRPGGYARTLAKIDKSLLMTFSAKDNALHDLFHLALRRDTDLGEFGIAGPGEPPSRYAALGGYGPREAGQVLHKHLPEPGVPIDVPKTPTPNAFDGSQGQVNNHGDVATRHTAWLMYLQLRG